MKGIYATRIREHSGIDNEILEYMEDSKTRFIYGNGAQAATCLDFFQEMEVAVQGILTLPGYEMPQLKGWWGQLLKQTATIDITELTEEQIHTAAVLMTVPREHYDTARVFLERMGFCHIYTCCWDRNQYLRDICLDVFEENMK